MGSNLIGEKRTDGPLDLVQIKTSLEEAEKYHVQVAILEYQQAHKTDQEEKVTQLLHEKNQERVLTVRDHKRLSKLKTTLNHIAKTLTGKNGENVSRNLAKAVGNYLIVQSMKDCRWKKRSSSVWGLSAQKNIELFRWMVGLNHDATLEVLVDLVVSPDKHEQLAGCMFIFELISIYALNLRNKSFTSTNDTAKEVPISICLQFFPHLISLAKKGSVISGDRIKPSILGQRAVDCLLVLTSYMSSKLLQSKEKEPSLCEANISTLLVTIEFVIDKLRTWNKDSTRPQKMILLGCLESLLVYSNLYRALDCTTKSTLEVMLWHWQYSAIYLCSHGECINTTSQAASSIISTIYHAHHSSCSDEHVQQAVFRNLCIRISTLSSTILKTVIFKELEVKGYFLMLIFKLIKVVCIFETVDPLLVCCLRYFLDDEVLLSDDEKYDVICQTMVYVASRDMPFPSIPQLVKFLAPSIIDKTILPPDIVIKMLMQPERHSFGRTECILDLIKAIYCQERRLHNLQLERMLRHQLSRPVLYAFIHWFHISSMRKRVTELFSIVDANEAIRFFIEMIVDEVPKKKEIAGAGLLLLFLYRSESMEKFQMDCCFLFDCMRYGCQRIYENISAPSEMVKQASNDSSSIEKDHRQEKALEFFKIWVRKLPIHLQTHLVTSLLKKLFRSPHDTFMVKAFREIAAVGVVTNEVFYEQVLPLVKHEMKHQEHLSDSLLDSDSYQSVAAVEALLFCHLAPLLILRVISHQLFNDTSDKRKCQLDYLFNLLLVRIRDPLEYKEVKMVSVEILEKLDVSVVLPVVLAELFAYIRTHGALDDKELSSFNLTSLLERAHIEPDCDFVTAKLMVYYLNRVSNQIASISYELIIWLSWTLLRLWHIPCASKTSNGEISPLADIQMGAIQCASEIVVISLNENTATIQNDMLQMILDSILLGYARTDYESFTWLQPVHARICCCNVLLSALQRFNFEENERVLVTVRMFLIEPILAQISLIKEKTIQGACLQIIFSFLFKGGHLMSLDDTVTADFIKRIFELTLQTVSKSNNPDEILLNGLKVFGALLSKIPNIHQALTSSQKDQTITVILSLRDSRKASPTLRKLAQSLLATAMTGN